MTTIVATDPGDIVVEFQAQIGNNVQGFGIPLKTISVNKTMDVSPEFGIGSHQAYAHTVGKIAYEGDFTIGSWWVSDESNPNTWHWLIREFLTFQDDEGLPREFTINIHARGGSAMIRQGTGTYGNSGGYSIPGNPQWEEQQGGYTAPTQGLVSDSMVIESYKKCILKGDGTDIPEVGGKVTRKYPFQCFRRDPK